MNFLNNGINRRRFIKIIGLSGIGAVTGGILVNMQDKPLHKVNWQGIALGAPSDITLFHHNKKEAQEILNKSIKQISHLENLFSLYKNDSQLSILNRDGFYNNPDKEMIKLFNLSIQYSALTEGAFDITVQPLWQLYNKSFSENRMPPKVKDINKILDLINWKSIEVSENKINYTNKGMSATLNGIAQGYITDKVTETFINYGVNNTLIQLGEYRAIGKHPDDRKWKLLLSNPEHNASIGEIEFENAAIATSAGKGTSFDQDGIYHHIFNPKDGLSSNNILQATVTAKSATEADALATSFLIMNEDKSSKLAKKNGIGLEIFNNNRERKVITTL
tara:strand:+ start:19495 stop:20496 length:1002 start_codon:yes stop_codon:yes gene_type:complete